MSTVGHTSEQWLASNRTARTHNHPERFWERHVHTAERLDLVGTGCGATQEEAEANAQLFAAAPDLLAALKGMVAWFACERGKAPVVEAHKAIAKAEGR